MKETPDERFARWIESVRSRLEPLDRQRRTAGNEAARSARVLVTGVLAILTASLVLVLLGLSNWLPVVIVGGAIAITFARAIGPAQPDAASIAAEYKRVVIVPLIEQIAAGLSYNPKWSVPEKEIRQSGLFEPDIERISGEDMFYGSIGATHVWMSEINVEAPPHRLTKPWFNGFFVSADFHKHFRGRTYVSSRMVEVVEPLIGRGDSEVRFEDPEFDRVFRVVSTDQVEARYILSTSLMRRLLDLQRRTIGAVRISFVQSRMYIALESSRNRFEPPLDPRIAMVDHVREAYHELSQCVRIVEDMGLNTRIWTKS